MINKFITEVKNRGIARTNSYEVRMSIPGTTSKGDELVTLFCDAANLPGLTVATTPARIYGEAREMPYEPMYEPVTLSFYVDSGMEIKRAFEGWIGSILNYDTREIRYYNTYVRDVSIKVIHRDYTPTAQSEQLITQQSIETASPYEVTLKEAYPKSIAAIQLDAGSKDIMKLQVTMQYKYWRAAGAASLAMNSPSAGVSSPFQDPTNINTGQGYPYEAEYNEQTQTPFNVGA